MINVCSKLGRMSGCGVHEASEVEGNLHGMGLSCCAQTGLLLAGSNADRRSDDSVSRDDEWC
jgi:hypothetical protein